MGILGLAKSAGGIALMMLWELFLILAESGGGIARRVFYSCAKNAKTKECPEPTDMVARMIRRGGGHA